MTSHAAKSKVSPKAPGNTICLGDLGYPHFATVARAINNILSTELAQVTFAQILDGLPLADVLQESEKGAIEDRDHPIFQHEKLRQGTMDRLLELRDKLEIATLKVESKSALLYKAAAPGSRSFNTRLIEIIARSIHQLAVLIFHSEPNSPENEKITSWTSSRDNELWWRFHPDGAPPTLFSHSWYFDYQQYPDGPADMVAYWAETRILGGVALFDQRNSNSDAVFLHPDREDYTYRIFELLDTQKLKLLTFLLSDTRDPAESPLPILPSDENRNRVDPEEPIKLTGIYRDAWERNLQPESFGDGRGRNVYDALNYTSLDEFFEAQARFRTKWRRYQDYY